MSPVSVRLAASSALARPKSATQAEPRASMQDVRRLDVAVEDPLGDGRTPGRRRPGHRSRHRLPEGPRRCRPDPVGTDPRSEDEDERRRGGPAATPGRTAAAAAGIGMGSETGSAATSSVASRSAAASSDGHLAVRTGGRRGARSDRSRRIGRSRSDRATSSASASRVASGDVPAPCGGRDGSRLAAQLVDARRRAPALR